MELLEAAGNMPGKWQLLIYLGQQTILEQQKAQPLTVLRFQARGIYPATGTVGSGCALDGTAKQCYNAVDLTETN